MEHLLNEKATHLEISGIRQFFTKVQQYPEALQLTLGQPDFSTPEHIKKAAIEAITNNYTTYTANAGLLELRKEAASYFQSKYNLDYDPTSEILVTVGASQGIDLAMRTILEPGDEVLIPAPVYPAYEPAVRLTGANPIYIDTSSTNFVLTVEQIEQHQTPATKAIILPYPSNPTGVVLSDDERISLAAYLKKKEWFIVSDEIYSELTYSSKHRSIAEEEGLKEKTIVINGLSKSHSMTGWRIGFLLAHHSISKHILKVLQYNVSCATSISQYAALEALRNGREDPVYMKKEYKKRRDYVMKRLEEMHLPAVYPDGAFYVFPKIKQSGLTSSAFAMKLLSEYKLALVPGNAFSHFGEGYVRLSYAYSQPVLEESLNQLEIFWKEVTDI